MRRIRISPIIASLIGLLSAWLCTSLLPLYAAGQATIQWSNAPVKEKAGVVRLHISERRPEIGQAVVLRAQLQGMDDTSALVDYTFDVNGERFNTLRGDTRIHIFRYIGTYKVIANAHLSTGESISSNMAIIRVVPPWIKPQAKITPSIETVPAGFPAVFYSESDVDNASRAWRYWELSTGHKGRGDEFAIDTSRLKPGRYTVKLLLRDDRQQESSAEAVLVVEEGQVEDESFFKPPDQPLLDQTPSRLFVRVSQKHRLANKPIIFWVESAQVGAGTLLRLESGDGIISSWERRFRYSHVYQSFGRYDVYVTAKTHSGQVKSNTVTVYIWPLWLPILLALLGLVLALSPAIYRYVSHWSWLKNTSHDQPIKHDVLLLTMSSTLITTECLIKDKNLVDYSDNKPIISSDKALRLKVYDDVSIESTLVMTLKTRKDQ